jgi:hypothetical protein
MRILLLLSVLLLQACSGDSDSPEVQIQRFIDSAVQAGEARSADRIGDLLHRDFIDQQGNNGKQIGRLLRAYFFRHQNIHLFTRIDDIEILADNQASVSLHVAMAGTVISDITALASLQARVYRFELQMVREDDDWLLRHASWESANLGAFD